MEAIKSKMKLIVPTLDIEEFATPTLIESVVNDLKGRNNPFLILQESELTYAQALWIGAGYELEYQLGSIDKHYRSVHVVSEKLLMDTLLAYMAGETGWNNRIEFEQKDLMGRSGRLGLLLGRLIGKIYNVIPKA